MTIGGIMGNPDADKIRQEAEQRIADRPNMVLDGDPIEELAKAHDRHAERLRVAIRSLDHVGRTNYLGDTVEGRAATYNIGVAVHDHENSVVQNFTREVQEAEVIAAALRQIAKDIGDTELENAEGIGKVRWR
ncbi:hypothetical protein HHU10_11995 [Tsukamurella columbiensis]|nr:hypothetical protein [Tsukamurella columbiensis]